jgi:uncharacterized protein YciI
LPVRQQAHWDEHARFVDALFDAGTLVMAGPFADDSGSRVVLGVESVEIARAIMQEDPWARRDILVTGEVKEWTIFLDARDKTQECAWRRLCLISRNMRRTDQAGTEPLAVASG